MTSYCKKEMVRCNTENGACYKTQCGLKNVPNEEMCKFHKKVFLEEDPFRDGPDGKPKGNAEVIEFKDQTEYDRLQSYIETQLDDLNQQSAEQNESYAEILSSLSKEIEIANQQIAIREEKLAQLEHKKTELSHKKPKSQDMKQLEMEIQKNKRDLEESLRRSEQLTAQLEKYTDNMEVINDNMALMITQAMDTLQSR